MEQLSEFIVSWVLIICLCIGYAVKHIPWIDQKFNDYIPIALMILGAIFSCTFYQSCSIEIIGKGMLTGLASVGLHQAFKRTIEGLSGHDN